MIINHLLFYLLVLHNNKNKNDLGGENVLIQNTYMDMNQFAQKLEKQKLLSNLLDTNVSTPHKIALIESYMGNTNGISAGNITKGQLLKDTDF